MKDFLNHEECVQIAKDTLYTALKDLQMAGRAIVTGREGHEVHVCSIEDFALETIPRGDDTEVKATIISKLFHQKSGLWLSIRIADHGITSTVAEYRESLKIMIAGNITHVPDTPLSRFLYEERL